MANAHCHDGYCAPMIETKEVTITEKILIGGGITLVAVLLVAFTFYGVSMGYYPDITNLY